MNEQTQPGLFIGIDWADQKHDCFVIDRDGKGFHQELKQSAESIDAWVGDMLKRADGQPIAIMLEQSRGPLVHALMFRENVLLFPINPKQFARYRESYPGGGKDDRKRTTICMLTGQIDFGFPGRRSDAKAFFGCAVGGLVQRV